MGNQPVSTQAIRVIKKGSEGAFEESLRSFFQQARPIPGQLSVSVVRPLPGSGSQEWGILRTFESEQHRTDFYASEVFKSYEAHVAQFTEGNVRLDHACGLETWFTPPGSQLIVPPPRWKMAIVTFVAVYVTSNAVGLVLGPAIRGLPGWMASAIAIGATVVCLTWVVMPFLARVLRPWLYPRTAETPTRYINS